MVERRSGTLRGLSIALSVAALTAASLLAAGAPAGAAKKKSKKATTTAAFCSNPGTDYAAPLEKLQAIPALPEGGDLPFGPEGMTISATGPQGVLVGGSNVGFRLTNQAASTSPTKRLNWTVLERLIRLTKNGQSLHPEGLKRIDLKQLPGGRHRGLVFPLAAKPAIYSLEVTIQNGRGRRRARYGEYIRVVERTVNVGMTLAAYDKIVPGSYLETCFENHGSASVTPTGGYLERYDGSSWHPYAPGARYYPEGWRTVNMLGPGESETVSVYVPSIAPPGLYKVLLSATTDQGEALTTSAEFGVL
ncbi:MAG: hypothetical protein QM729_04760 [Solirubrobacterales bacterium]